MQHSLLNQSTVKDLLAQACQNKENGVPVVPMVFLSNGTETLKIVPVPDLAADADAKRSQFSALDKQFPDTTEAVFICETWFVIAERTVDAHKVMPSEHSCRQEAIMLAGRNRSNTQSVGIVKPFFTIQQDFFWLSSAMSTTPGSAPSPLDHIFAP